MQQAILSTAYFPNIQYLSKFIKYDNIVIDIYEHYSKQSYRNRCNILSANGVLPLSIPVKKNNHCYTKDIKIDYSEPWQKLHEKAILSAYNNSPFYEYYIDEFMPFFIKQEVFLIDINTKILDKILKILKIEKNYSFSNDFIVLDKHNFRESIHPKSSKYKEDNDFISKPYIQVFSEKFGFIENLSCLDLIFLQGPMAKSFLS